MQDLTRTKLAERFEDEAAEVETGMGDDEF